MHLLVHLVNDLNQNVIVRQGSKSKNVIILKVLMSEQGASGCLKAKITQAQKGMRQVVFVQKCPIVFFGEMNWFTEYSSQLLDAESVKGGDCNICKSCCYDPIS